jgi:hypothetical protein
MLRKATYDHRLVTDGWVSIDPADEAILEGVYKEDPARRGRKADVRGLGKCLEYFQKYVLARKPSGKQLFREAEEWFLDKDSATRFTPLKASARPWGCIPTQYGRA